MTRLRASSRALLTELGDGTGVLLHLDSKFYYILNPTGLHVWRALQAPEGATNEELAEALSQEFEVEPKSAASDLVSLLDELQAENLVENVGPK